LVVGKRGAGEAFSPADLQLLDDLAQQAAVAVHAVALTTDLRRSRERIVTAREEERRRLRRDLHDGLGPTLAAIAVRAEAAKRVLGSDPERAVEALTSIAADAQSAVVEVRRIVQDLRPPALDELGLVGAVRARADHFGEHLVIDVSAPERLDDLPAAVESVAYRIVSEALTNVVRHSGASHAWVCIEDDPHALVIDVSDDGAGVAAGDPVGVGLASMHERAAELGGTCSISPRSEGGTRVHVVLPVHTVDTSAERLS
jgi:signal transduction histidine kinase